MKGTKGAPPTDLLVCFPSRSHLSLMPKQICSPVRPNDASKRHHHHLHNQKGNGGQAGSPLLWAKTSKAMGSEMDEPTSPKVTCAGQIKVRPKPSSCKNWQSVMEEIERLHKHNNSNNTSRNNNNKHKNKKATWGEALGFKKDVMQFLTCLRGLRFDLRCFGSFQGSDVISDDEDDDEEGEEEEEEEEESEVGVESSSSRAVFSKWYMVLQENKKEQDGCDQDQEEEDRCGSQFPSAPPPNALLLMRCRSAPAKSWLEEKEEEEEEEEKKQQQQQNKEEEEKMKEEAMLMEEEKRKENLILRCYSPDFFKVSSDVAKETWVVGGVRDNPLSRSRSWKR